MRPGALPAWLVLPSVISISLAALGPLGAPARAACEVAGPATVREGQPFRLCGELGAGFTYEWHGPGLDEPVRSRCLRFGGLAVGAHSYVVVRRRDGVEVDRCTQLVTVRPRPARAGARSAADCLVRGPAVLSADGRARLCGPSLRNAVYRWTGPGGFQSGAACVVVDRAGAYELLVRNRATGFVHRCQHVLAGRGAGTEEPEAEPRRYDPNALDDQRAAAPGPRARVQLAGHESGAGAAAYALAQAAPGQMSPGEDPRLPERYGHGNCPRALAFWASVCSAASGPPDNRELGLADLRLLAGCIDAHSAYFRWANDLDGLCQALSPGARASARQRMARELAVLLANTCASELGLTVDGRELGVAAGTRVANGGARTVADLAARADRLLVTRRSDPARVEAAVRAVNAGQGIGPVCE